MHETVNHKITQMSTTTSLKERREARLFNKRMDVIVEALNKEDFATATQIINKLEKMKNKGLTNLDSAISKAQAELNKYVQGGKLADAWQSIRTMVGLDNPLVKVMTFANALETGFSQVQQIIQNNLQQVDKSKSLAELGLSPDKLKTVVGTLQKALSPGGVFAGAKTVPYINKKSLVSDLINTPISKLESVAQVASEGPQTNQIAPDMKDVANKGGGVQTTTTGAKQVNQQTTKEKATQATKSSIAPLGSTPTGQQTPTGVKQQAQKFVDRLKKERMPEIENIINSGGDAKKLASKILTYLIKNGEIKP